MVRVKPQCREFKNEITINLEGMGPIQSEEAERALLGAILSQSEQVMILCSEAELTSEHFFNPSYKQLYAAMEDMERKRTPIDLATVMQYLDDRKLSSAIGGGALLGDLAAGVISWMTAPAHIHTILSKARLRKIFEAGAKMAYDAHERQHEVNSVVDNAERSIIEITTKHSRSEVKHFSGALDAVFNDAMKEFTKSGELQGPSTGWHRLDAMIMGFKAGSMIVVAARSNQGKTNLCLSWMRNLARNGVPSAGISLESEDQKLARRMLSMHSDISYTKTQKRWLDKDEKNILCECKMEMEEWPIYFQDKAQSTIGEVKTAIRIMVRKHGCKVVWVDHAGLIKVPGALSEQDAMTEVSKDLSALRKELGICLIVLLQLKKPKDGDENRRPTKEDMNFGAQFDRDADEIFMMHREKGDNRRPMPTGWLYGEKGRDVEIGDIEIEVSSSTMLVEELQVKAV